MILDGPNVSLRPVTVEDAEAFLPLRRHPGGMPGTVGDDPRFFTLDGQREFMARMEAKRERDELYSFAIVREGAIIGEIALTGVVRRFFENAGVGYFLAPEHHGRGYGTEALQLATGFAFDSLKLHRLQASTATNNLASQRVLEKAGYRREGTALRLVLVDGTWTDSHLWAMTAEEWPPG